MPLAPRHRLHVAGLVVDGGWPSSKGRGSIPGLVTDHDPFTQIAPPDDARRGTPTATFLLRRSELFGARGIGDGTSFSVLPSLKCG